LLRSFRIVGSPGSCGNSAKLVVTYLLVLLVKPKTFEFHFIRPVDFFGSWVKKEQLRLVEPKLIRRKKPQIIWRQVMGESAAVVDWRIDLPSAELYDHFHHQHPSRTSTDASKSEPCSVTLSYLVLFFSPESQSYSIHTPGLRGRANQDLARTRFGGRSEAKMCSLRGAPYIQPRFLLLHKSGQFQNPEFLSVGVGAVFGGRTRVGR
jgi:hypothetical protein